MADPRFFTVAGPFTLGQIAQICGAELAPGADADLELRDVAPLDQAGPGQISFLDNRKYAAAFEKSAAAAAVVRPEMSDRAPAGMALLLSADPYRAYAKVARAFYPAPAPEPWVAPTASVDPTATIGEGGRIEPGAVVGARVVIGPRCRIAANAVIGDGVEIGADCVIGANSTVQFALLGNRVVIYPGARIGQDGFGFAMGPQGHLKVPQLGRVIIEDDVEVGANTTIDRGAGPDTVIGAGTMIDNLVQIGHNVQIGRACVLVAQMGISGSTHLGDFVAVGGQSGIAGHLKIGSGAQIAAKSGVMRDVLPGEILGGYPAVTKTEWLRQAATLGKLTRLKR